MQGDIDPHDLNNFTNNYINYNDEEKQKKDAGKIVRNTYNILRDLEDSIKKSVLYEEQIFKCSGHLHSPPEDAGYHTEPASKVSLADNASQVNNVCRTEVNLSDSWSTMSIVCLQYQYDELTKKYQNLLKVHNESTKDLSSRESSLINCQCQMDSVLEELEDAQKTVQNLCTKYITLKRKKDRDKAYYEQKISMLAETSASLLSLLKQSREEVDDILCEKIMVEPDPRKAMLLTEIRRSNRLFQENLRLKARIQELAPGTVEWQISHW